MMRPWLLPLWYFAVRFYFSACTFYLLHSTSSSSHGVSSASHATHTHTHVFKEEMAQLSSRSDLVNQGRLADHHVHEIIFAMQLRNTVEVTRILHDASDPLSRNYRVAVATSPFLRVQVPRISGRHSGTYLTHYLLLLIITPTANISLAHSS
jgi:hypothetical protein